jgi:hypothetical protein
VSDPTLTPMFQSLPGANFIVNGALPVKDSALASAGAEFRLANGVTLLSKFDGEFASRSTTLARAQCDICAGSFRIPRGHWHPSIGGGRRSSGPVHGG